jgi:hypothetical protein
MLKYILILIFPAVFIFAQTGPKLDITGGEEINTGSHIRGKEVNYEIKFTNSGDSVLKINGVQATCGCSSALSSGDVFQPGESGTISFTFNGQGFGMVQKSLIVSTNETQTPYHTLHMNMNMVDPITINPQSIMTAGKVGDEIKQTATLVNSLDKDITITEITSNTPVIKTTSDKMSLAPGETATMNISIKIFEESAINAAIIIKTTEGEFQIPVFVDVKTN